MTKCIGRTKRLKRCQNTTKWVVCRHHWTQPFAALITVVSTILLVPNFYDSIIRPLKEGDVTVSPARMKFSGGPYSEQYTVTVHNRTLHPIYNVWLELRLINMSHDEVSVEASPNKDAECIPVAPIRLDTSGFVMRDLQGEVSFVVALIRIGPRHTYEYVVTRSRQSGDGAVGVLEASILGKNQDIEPIRIIGDSSSYEVMFPTRLPKNGDIVAPILFECK